VIISKHYVERIFLARGIPMLKLVMGVLAVVFAILGSGAVVRAQIDFSVLPTFPADAQTEMVLHDVDNDGDVDMVTADGISNLVGVYLSNGDGTFALPFTRIIPSGVRALAVGDVNSDGLSDILLAYPGNLSGSNGIVSVLLNQGGGCFCRR